MAEFKGTKGKWLIGKAFGAIISKDVEQSKKEHYTDGEIEYYGGLLVCESVRSNADAKLIAAAPELLEALQELIQVKDWKDIYGKDAQYLKAQPVAWNNAIEAIKKATE